uniref:F-box/LRR-repeat protein n=1 Tax=Panagrellus redivivus TaxID=6233 RepID=A0A7E4WDF5_PANRE
MPYPITNLAYGLRCRLSELSTPVERYNLQIAAGNTSTCPPKLQIVQETLESLIFGCKNGTISAYRNFDNYLNKELSIVCQDDSITICNDSVSFYRFDVQSLNSDILDHFLFNAGSLKLMHCHLSKPFYETLKMRFLKVQYLEMYGYTEDYRIDFTNLLTMFPYLQSLDAKGPLSENWISEILQVKNHSLMSLTTLKKKNLSQLCVLLFGATDAFDFVQHNHSLQNV